jgi:NDP-sugar pyrophosphorylase family protein
MKVVVLCGGLGTRLREETDGWNRLAAAIASALAAQPEQA